MSKSGIFLSVIHHIPLRSDLNLGLLKPTPVRTYVCVGQQLPLNKSCLGMLLTLCIQMKLRDFALSHILLEGMLQRLHHMAVV